MSSKQGKFFVISAPSGTGKTTVVKRILKEVPDCVRSVSMTTRKRRQDEQEGIDYRFVDPETFRKKIDEGDFFEWEEVHGHLYGTPRSLLEEARLQGKSVILDIDVRGALSVKRAYPDSCLIFLKPPSKEVLERRLKGRKTEQEEALRARLKAAERELEEQKNFDYVIINDDLEKAIGEVRKLIEEKRTK